MFGKKDPYLSREEELVNQLLHSSAQAIQDKYSLKLSGQGSSMPGGDVRELVLTFDIRNPTSREDLRKLLIGSAQEVVKQAQANKDIQPFLHTKPFSIQHVQIILYVFDREGKELHDPDISFAEISGGILTYETMDPDNPYRFKNEYRETYEEALKSL